MTAKARDERDLGAFIPSFLDDYPLNPFEFRVYAHIARRAGSGECWESINAIARHCHMNLKTTRAAIHELIKNGLLTYEERPGQTNLLKLTHHSHWKAPESVVPKKAGNPTPTKFNRTTKFDPPPNLDHPPLPNLDRGDRSNLDHPPLPNLDHKGTPIEGTPNKVLPVKESHGTCEAIAPSSNSEISEPEPEPIKPEIVASLPSNAEPPTQNKAGKRKKSSAARRKVSSPNFHPEAFEQFWASWRSFCFDVDIVNPGERKEAVQAWNALFEDGINLAQLMEGFELYCTAKRYERAKKGEAIGVPHACRWLSNRKWQDALDWRDRKSQVPVPSKADVKAHEIRQTIRSALEGL